MKKVSLIIRGLYKNARYDLRRLQKQFGIHPHTVRDWVKSGLPVLQKRPIWLFSEDIRDFLIDRQRRNQIELSPTQFLCLKCRCGKSPRNKSVYAEHKGLTLKMKAICETCNTLMNKAVSSKKPRKSIPMFKRITLEQLRILQSPNSSLNLEIADPRLVDNFSRCEVQLKLFEETQK